MAGIGLAVGVMIVVAAMFLSVSGRHDTQRALRPTSSPGRRSMVLRNLAPARPPRLPGQQFCDADLVPPGTIPGLVGPSGGVILVNAATVGGVNESPFSITAHGLAPSTQAGEYAVWITQVDGLGSEDVPAPGARPELLGVITPGVGKDGKLAVAGVARSGLSGTYDIRITLQPNGSVTKPAGRCSGGRGSYELDHQQSRRGHHAVRAGEVDRRCSVLWDHGLALRLPMMMWKGRFAMIRRTGRNAAYLRRARALATALAAVAVTLSTALASSGAQARGATLLYAERFDPAAAAHLEVQWWRVHRDAQRSTRASDGPALADALARLHSHVYGVPERSVRRAAEQRALAMRYSDQWVSEGCHPDSTLINHERDALVRPYAALLEAVQSPQCPA